MQGPDLDPRVRFGPGKDFLVNLIPYPPYPFSFHLTRFYGVIESLICGPSYGGVDLV